ncbi:MAG: branched-chain amino acid ABC transporter permease [Candidatus Dormibacteria bacterium]
MLNRLFRPFRPGGRVQGTAVFWIVASTAALLLLMGWLMPWFIGPFSAGSGFSPEDVVSSPPIGVGTFLTYAMAVTMVILVVSPLLELGARFTRRRLGPRADRIRLVAALAGLALTIVVWLLVIVIQEEPLFGPVSNSTITDSAVWLTMYGYALAALAYGARHWLLTRPNLAFGLAALPFGALLPLIFHQAPDFLYWAASSLAIYMLLALGLNVVVGFAGLLDLGYAAFFAIGAYACASLASPAHHVHLPLWVLIFIGAAVASLFGAVLGAPTLRLRGDYLAIVTLGFGEIVPDLATNNVFNLTGGPNGISGIDQPKVGPISFGSSPQWYYWSLLALSVIVVILLRNIQSTRVGRAWVALREDEVAAAATGINTTSTKLLAFAIGASVSGLAGAFYGSLVTIVSPDDFSFSISIAVLSIIVLGGIGNIAGVILGSFVLTFVIFWGLPHMNEWSTTVGQTFNMPALSGINFSSYTYVVYGVALILMMLFRPGGLLPSRARKVELESTGESESLAAVQGRA